MEQLPLHLRDGHLFLELGGSSWLIDSGSPLSFGAFPSLSLAGEQFSLSNSYLGLTAKTLSQLVKVECCGLLGADILGSFDLLLDVPGELLTISTAELEHTGAEIDLELWMGIPIVHACICGVDYRMFFDTGAQLSYFQDDSLASFPPAGLALDFYPGFGELQTETRYLDLILAGITFTLRCGVLPSVLGLSLMMAGTKGIIGNELIRHRPVGYFPRRRVLVL